MRRSWPSRSSGPWDEMLPVEIRELPEDLARLDRVLSDDLLLFPIARA